MNGRGLVLPVVAVAVWELLGRTGARSDLIALPSEIVVRASGELSNGVMLHALGQTLVSTFAGLLVGSALGITIGLITGLSRHVENLTFAAVELFRPVPAVALIPSLMLLLGFGYRFEVAIVAFACLWPMVIMTHAAVRSIEPPLFEVAKALRFGFLARSTKIYLPAILPRLFVALRLTLGLALIVAVTVEIAANPQGVGFLLIQAQQNLQPDMLFAVLLFIGLVGWAFNEVLVATQARLFKGREQR
jgi:NitT/TauT family transport system permease protein